MKKFFIYLALASTLAGGSVAETREQCELDVRHNTKIATGVALGTGAGAITGAAACSGLLGLVLFDFGVSYATCVALVTATGAALGTAIGDDVASNQLTECQKLPPARLMSN